MAYDGTAYNQAMGGIGIGMRDNGYINYTNPAAITARDTLAFMLDFGLNQQNLYTNDNVTKAAYNVFNMQNVALTVHRDGPGHSFSDRGRKVSEIRNGQYIPVVFRRSGDAV